MIYNKKLHYASKFYILYLPWAIRIFLALVTEYWIYIYTHTYMAKEKNNVEKQKKTKNVFLRI